MLNNSQLSGNPGKGAGLGWVLDSSEFAYNTAVVERGLRDFLLAQSGFDPPLVSGAVIWICRFLRQRPGVCPLPAESLLD
jgi:hypothetical protein